MVICLERDADLHTPQPMPLPLTVSCFSKIQIGFTFLVPAHPGSPGQRAIMRVCVCKSQGSTARHLRCDGLLHYTFTNQFAGENRRTFGEVMGKSLTRGVCVSVPG